MYFLQRADCNTKHAYIYIVCTFGTYFTSFCKELIVTPGMLTCIVSGGGDQFGFLTRCNLPVWDKPQHHHHILVVFVVVVVDIFVVFMSIIIYVI